MSLFNNAKILIYLTPLIILGIIFYLQTNPLGLKRTYVYDFSRSSRVISHLGPPDRIYPIDYTNGRAFQSLRSGLVYFTLERATKNKTINLIIEFDTNLPYLGLGVEKNRTQEANFEFRPLVKNNIKQSNFDFAIKKYYLDEGSLRFAFSVPPLGKQDYVKIYKISATYDEPADKWIKTLRALLGRFIP